MTAPLPSTASLRRALPPGPIAEILLEGPVVEVLTGGGHAQVAEEHSQQTVVAIRRLQDVADYRAALQAWFRALRIGGHLIVTVPHAFLYERSIALPSPWHPRQKRLYTPASLLGEVEEALVPNSYRVRWLGDQDTGYDYAAGNGDTPPASPADIMLVLERITPPAWPLVEQPEGIADAPDYGFEPDHSRLESTALMPYRRVLILKLDHLGDFIMGIPALEKARATFGDTDITLVVGSWNLDIARQLGVADRVIPFDVFPRNSSEEEVDVPGKRALFEALITEDYDLAIDLRTDHDTRFLLRSVRTTLRAGIGGGGEFPYLDIFLPTGTRHAFETARADLLGPERFSAQGTVARSAYRLACTGVEDAGSAIIWGPYLRLVPGRYIFEPFVEIEPEGGGLLLFDIGLDTERVTEIIMPRPETSTRPVSLRFTVERPDTQFEFRIWPIGDGPIRAFSFFGGRLLYEGAGSVLHQSEYLLLLIELIAMRVARFGVFGEEREG